MRVILLIFGSDLRKIAIQIKLMLIAISIFLAIIMCYAVKIIVKWCVEKKAKKKNFKITKEGSGNTCGKGKHVYVAYKGYLVDGKVFDSSEGRGDLDFTTGAGQMIPGFDIMVQNMKRGESRTIVLPPDLAYGEQGYPGVIPPASYIAFDVTLNKF